MRILLDECLPAGLRRDIVGHEVMSAPHLGWAGIKNGTLLARAIAEQFDVFLTVDKNLPSQQKLSSCAIAVIVLRCRSNDINALRKLVPTLLAKLPAVRKGEALIIS